MHRCAFPLCTTVVRVKVSLYAALHLCDGMCGTLNVVESSSLFYNHFLKKFIQLSS